jgi:hypothetical protein
MTGLSMLLRGFERTFDPLAPHIRFFSARSLGTLLDEMGFTVESSRVKGGTLFVVASR